MTGTFALVLANGDESSGTGLLLVLLVLLLAWGSRRALRVRQLTWSHNLRE